jgi:hypothetical protein
MRRQTMPALVLLAALAAACTAPATTPPPPPPPPPPAADPAPPPQQACTRIGCEDGWSVELADAATALPATYTIRVIVDGAVVASAQCTPERQCGEHVFLAGVTAEQAELEISSGPVPLRWTVTPQYNTLQPNGPGCPPTCRQARVQVRLGG